jgi:hypothetical protein
MAEMTLELIASASSSYEQAQSIVLELVNHVHQRIERFRYLDDIKPVAVALDYLENPELDSWRHLQVANRTYGIAANSDKNAEVRKEWAVTTATAVASEYKKVLITNKLGVDPHGKKRPLFWRHILPDNTVSCQVEVVSRGNVQKVDTGYVLNLDEGNLYTNFRNFFDPDTGAYTLFFITTTDEDGGTKHQLLYPQAVAKEADWQDIDLDTGRLTKDYPVYSGERNSSGYTFYMNEGDTWYSRPVEGSLIQPRLPTGRDPEDPWYLRFSAGDLTTIVNGGARRYHVPEFDQQNYAPYKPYIYSPYERVLWVSERVLASTRRGLAIDPESGLHLTLFISDYENNLLRVLTTDDSLDGVRYSNTDVFYEAGQIRSWDNEGGFVALNTKLHPSYQLSARYYYEADDYEYIGVNLNPLYNKDIVDKMVVFYMVPDVDPDDNAIHHLIVDKQGVIRECSQELGFSYENLQLLDSDGVYNPSTVIGKKYISDVETDTFINQYTAGYSNSKAYGILAEVVVLNLDDEDDMLLYDVREIGGSLRADTLEDALKANPRILQSAVMYGEEGQEVPKNKVVILQAPLSLRDDYGGTLPQERAESLLTQHLDSACLAVIEWEYPKTEITAWSQVAEQVDLSWTWEGPGLTYRLYKRTNPVAEWEEIYSVAGSSTPEEMSYTDEEVTAGDVVYYTVRTEETVRGETVLYPRTHSISVKVASE